MLNSVGERPPPCEMCDLYICSVGFASVDVVCDELNDCAWYLGLISVCMFIVPKALLISSATVLFAQGWEFVRAGLGVCSRRVGSWLNPFATVLFTVCSAVTVKCRVLYPCCVGVFGMIAVM